MKLYADLKSKKKTSNNMTNEQFNHRPVNIDYFQPHGPNYGRSSRTLASHIKSITSEHLKPIKREYWGHNLDYFRQPFKCSPHGEDILVSAYGNPVGLMYTKEVSASYLEAQLNQTT